MAKEIAGSILGSDANLKGYWRFENNLNDSSASGYNLTDHSSTDDASGEFGHARAFTAASSQYCDITNASAPNLYTTSDQTITAWIKPTGFTGARSIFSNANSSVNTGFSLQTETTTGKLEFRSFKSGDDQSVVSSGAISTGVWTHVAVVFTASGNAVALFVNGVKTTGSFSRALVSTTANTAIARLGSFSGQYFDGSIDDVAFFNRVLTDAEIQEEMYSGSASLSISLSPSSSISSSVSLSPSVSVSLSPSLTPSSSESLSSSSSISLSPSSSQSPSFSISLSPSLSESFSPSSSQSPSSSVSLSESLSISLSPSISPSSSPSPTPVENSLDVDLVCLSFLIVYNDKYAVKNTSYSDKYSQKNTTYSDKYSVKNTTYTDKYSTETDEC